MRRPTAAAALQHPFFNGRSATAAGAGAAPTPAAARAGAAGSSDAPSIGVTGWGERAPRQIRVGADDDEALLLPAHPQQARGQLQHTTTAAARAQPTAPLVTGSPQPTASQAPQPPRPAATTHAAPPRAASTSLLDRLLDDSDDDGGHGGAAAGASDVSMASSARHGGSGSVVTSSRGASVTAEAGSRRPDDLLARALDRMGAAAAPAPVPPGSPRVSTSGGSSCSGGSRGHRRRPRPLPQSSHAPPSNGRRSGQREDVTRDSGSPAQAAAGAPPDPSRRVALDGPAADVDRLLAEFESELDAGREQGQRGRRRRVAPMSHHSQQHAAAPEYPAVAHSSEPPTSVHAQMLAAPSPLAAAALRLSHAQPALQRLPAHSSASFTAQSAWVSRVEAPKPHESQADAYHSSDSGGGGAHDVRASDVYVPSVMASSSVAQRPALARYARSDTAATASSQPLQHTTAIWGAAGGKAAAVPQSTSRGPSAAVFDAVDAAARALMAPAGSHSALRQATAGWHARGSPYDESSRQSSLHEHSSIDFSASRDAAFGSGAAPLMSPSYGRRAVVPSPIAAGVAAGATMATTGDASHTSGRGHGEHRSVVTGVRLSGLASLDGDRRR